MLTEGSTSVRVSRRSQRHNRILRSVETNSGEIAFIIFAVISFPNTGIISCMTFRAPKQTSARCMVETLNIKQNFKTTKSHNYMTLLPEFWTPFTKNGSKISTNFLAGSGSFMYFDNNLKILISVSPGHLTNFLSQ